MRDREVLVRFRPANAEVYVLPGTRLVEAAAEAGIVLDAPCGGEGLCGKCRVLVAAAAEPTPLERERLSAEQLRAGWRLACQSQVREPMEVAVPAAPAMPQIAVEKAVEKGSELFSGPSPLPDPPVQKRYVELPPPARGDDLPDLLRLERAIGGEALKVNLSWLRQIPGRLRENDFRGTAVLADGRLLDFEPGNTAADAFAVALDLGTTTLVAELLDLGSGARCAVDARLNPQIRFGDDVLSRILYARQTPDGLRQLQQAAASAVDQTIGELCRQAGIARNRVYELTVSGNTTMQQLLCGIDTSPLGEVPFVPAGGRGLSCLARDLGINIHPRGAAYVMPVIGGFVGGDTVAGILATGMFGGADIPVCPACGVSPGGQECPPHREEGASGRRPRAHAAGRYRHQRRNRAAGRGEVVSGVNRGRPGLRGGENLVRHARLHRRHREGRGRERPPAGQRDRQRPADGPLWFGPDRHSGRTAPPGNRHPAGSAAYGRSTPGRCLTRPGRADHLA